ncbi:hypothetical protein ABPG74_010608 [Tetrahymena malaccensis]
MKKQIQQEEDWNQVMAQQQEYNRQIMEEEKILERAKKDLLIQQYQQFQQENQKKVQDNASKRIQEQTEMDQKIQQFRQDEQSRQNFQKELRSFLSNNYKDQIANKKQAEQQFKRDKIQEEQLNIQRAQQSLQQEQQIKFQQRQQAKQEMLDFYNNKKKLQTEQMADRNQQREEYRQMIQQQAQIQQIKEDNYRKYYQQFDQFQSNVAKNFIPFDHNKEKRIQDMIERGIQQDQQKQLREEQNRKQNLISRRVDLKTGLQEQLAQKEKNGYQKKGYLYNQDDILSKSLEQRPAAQYQSLQPSQQQLGYQNQTENKVIVIFRDLKSNQKTIIQFTVNINQFLKINIKRKLRTFLKETTVLSRSNHQLQQNKNNQLTDMKLQAIWHNLRVLHLLSITLFQILSQITSKTHTYQNNQEVSQVYKNQLLVE